MSESYVKQGQLNTFADEVVNLHRDDVSGYREQVKRLRDQLAVKINADPNYGLVKMLHSGSVAKGTALRTINDMDVAVYVRSTEAPADETQLLAWLADRLKDAYPTLKPEQFQPQTHCVKISFRSSGLDVDVVTVLYEGDGDDQGYLITKDTGERVLTSIPLHLAFIRSRKQTYGQNFAQLVRFVKWWIRQMKQRDESFRFKSFMAELLCAHLASCGLDLSDHGRALEGFFAYIVQTKLRERIAFADHYSASALPKPNGAAIEIFDPVNPLNNVASSYRIGDRSAIVEAAADALDALTEAHYATTKGRAVDRWQVVFGSSFRG